MNPTGDVLMSPAIADVYESTTVIFADLAGFTSWCSERTPDQVLILSLFPPPPPAFPSLPLAHGCMLELEAGVNAA
jgi:hypothetical protein